MGYLLLYVAALVTAIAVAFGVGETDFALTLCALGGISGAYALRRR